MLTLPLDKYHKVIYYILMKDCLLDTIITTASVKGLNLILTYDETYNKYVGSLVDNYGHLHFIEEDKELPQLLVILNKILI